MFNQEPVLSVICKEPEGEILRNVYPAVLTGEALRTFWEKARKYKTLFNQEIRDNFDRFCSIFLRQLPGGLVESCGLLWVVDDFTGVFYITDIYYPNDAQVHYSWLDGRHKGRAELGAAMVKYVFDTYKFNRLSAQIPLYVSPHTLTYVKQCGFRAEGRKRKTHEFNNQYFDSIIYGVVNPAILAADKTKEDENGREH